MIEEAEALLLRASAMGVIGRYQLEAAVQSAHAVRRLTGPVGLGRDRTALRGAVGDHQLTGGRDQPRRCDRRDARGGGGTGVSRCAAARQATGGVSALLGRPRGPAGALRRRPTQPNEAYERAIGLEADPAVRDSCSNAVTVIGLLAM